MGLFKKNTLEKARAAVVAAKARLDEITEKCRHAEAELAEAWDNVRRAEEENGRRAFEGGEPLINVDYSRPARFQRNEDAMELARARAERSYELALRDYEAAAHADRVARLDEAMRATTEIFKLAIAKSEAQQAIRDEDLKIPTVELGFLVGQLRHWVGLAEAHLNPPPPPAPDPDQKIVRFLKSFSGRPWPDNFRSWAGGFNAGDRAGFHYSEANYLVEMGFAVEVKPDAGNVLI